MTLPGGEGGLPTDLHARVERQQAFMAARNWNQASVALFGIPFDGTTSYRPGARFGPAGLRAASYGLEEYSLALDRSLDEVAFCDIGDVALPLGNTIACLHAAEAVADAVLAAGRCPLAMGGEHLVSLPLIRAAAQRHPDLAVLQFDAHADLRDDYLGVPLSHACVMRRVAEFVAPERIHQFGIRSATREEAAYARAQTRFHAHPQPLVEALVQAAPELAGRPVYVTIDVDVLDPAFAPGTGTPEPGGVRPDDLFAAITQLARLIEETHMQVVAADLVEVAPTLDPSGCSAVAGAKILRELLLSCFVKPEQARRGDAPPATEGAPR